MMKLSGPDRAMLYATAAYTGLAGQRTGQFEEGQFQPQIHSKHRDGSRGLLETSARGCAAAAFEPG